MSTFHWTHLVLHGASVRRTPNEQVIRTTCLSTRSRISIICRFRNIIGLRDGQIRLPQLAGRRCAFYFSFSARPNQLITFWFWPTVPAHCVIIIGCMSFIFTSWRANLGKVKTERFVHQRRETVKYRDGKVVDVRLFAAWRVS